MLFLHAAWALLPEGFAPEVTLGVEAGAITSLTVGAAPPPRAERVHLLLPGMPNLHSHAFQRVFAGHTQHVGGGTDFWSWREAMYSAAGRMTPALYAPVMAWLAKTLLKGGYTAHAEFHYLHHTPGGTPHATETAMADALAEGAARAGLPLTLLPVVYERAGFSGAPLGAAQRRFRNGLEAACRMAQHAGNAGIALHSLRAVPPAEVARAATAWPAGPVHIHVAEQLAEVAECQAVLGAPPVAWLLDNAPVDARWCLVHATHATQPELAAAAARGAVIGLCPSTEADLGDGIFDYPALRAAGGAWGIGSDSNTALDAFGELRLLEWGQRLALRRRNVAAGTAGHSGAALWAAAASGGARACGRAAGTIAAGARADLVVPFLPPEAADADGPTALDAAIFAPREPGARHVMADGVWRVRDGTHAEDAAIDAAYAQALRTLRA